VLENLRKVETTKASIVCRKGCMHHARASDCGSR